MYKLSSAGFHVPLQLASCLIYARGHDLTDDGLPISLTADAYFGARLSAFFIEPDILKTMYRSTIPLRFI